MPARCSRRPAGALAELRAVVERRTRARALDARAGARRARASCRSTSARPPQPDRVQVASPEAIRARRFEAVFVCGLQEGEFPRGAPARAVPARRGPARDRHGERAGAAGPRGPPRPRALPVLRLRLARRAPAGALVALERRGGQPRGASRSSSTTCATCSTSAGRARDAVAGGRDLAARAGAHRRRVGAGARRGRSAPREEPPARPAARGAAAGASSPRATRVSAGALERFADCPVKWLVENVLRPGGAGARPRADGARRATPTRCSSTPSSGCARRPASAG